MRMTPTDAIGTLWPGIRFDEPSWLYLPVRGPTMIAAARAAAPPLACSTAQPAPAAFLDRAVPLAYQPRPTRMSSAPAPHSVNSMLELGGGSMRGGQISELHCPLHARGCRLSG